MTRAAKHDDRLAPDGMAAMERNADDPPPPYFGDYPHGAYWSAFRQDSSVDDDGEAENFTVEGTRLRIMWDEGAGPLWGVEGLLPDDPEWLRQALGLSPDPPTDFVREQCDRRCCVRGLRDVAQ